MIYLDNSATTALCEKARKRMTEAMDCFGNPSSLHSVGYEASLMLGNARQCVAESLGLRRSHGYEIFFTGSGTEANNMAITGCALSKRRMESRRIITTDSEHPSILEPVSHLSQMGFEAVRISTRGGVLDMRQLEDELKKGACILSLMLVNNETGARYDVEQAFAMAKRHCPDIVTHCDATQAYLKVAFTVPHLGADMVTVSGHKIHGPKGIGVLCVSPAIIKAKKIIPVIRGGGQEKSMRSGTENMIGISGMWGAVEQYFPTYRTDAENMADLRDYACTELAEIDGVRLNMPQKARAPHIVNITLPDIKSETMVHFLSSQGIAVSGGSACSSHSEQVSQSLLGFGLDKKAASCSIRISLCDSNTKDDIDKLVSALREGIGRLVRIR